jgi:hypothetical protein
VNTHAQNISEALKVLDAIQLLNRAEHGQDPAWLEGREIILNMGVSQAAVTAMALITTLASLVNEDNPDAVLDMLRQHVEMRGALFHG